MKLKLEDGTFLDVDLMSFVKCQIIARFTIVGILLLLGFGCMAIMYFFGIDLV